jgi:NADH-quinone oxidoreductase subunit N
VNYLELLKLAAPETILVVTVLAVLAVDLLVMREKPVRRRLTLGAAISCLGCVAAILCTANCHTHANFPDDAGFLVVNPLTQLVKQIILVLTIFTALLSLSSRFTEHVGEYFALLLFATVGMLFLVSSEDILMIFISLELTSLSLYILTAFNKRNVRSVEAALKYFLFGGMAAAFTLFGLSLLYGLSGATNLGQIAAGLKGKGLDPLLVVALVMTVIGFAFKIAAVPFHLWAPDAYQGAPTPSAALIASGSKVASFFVLARVMTLGFAGVEGSGAWRDFVPGWVPLLAVLATASMIAGNLAAIVQKSVRRLLAYSAIAHAGYVLLAVLANRVEAMQALLYYLTTYALTVIGAFCVVSVVEERAGDDSISAFAGLSGREPGLSFCVLVFMLSLAGIPPLAGFFGKFYVFTIALSADPKNLGLLWLVILAVAMSTVSLYYYLQVLKQIFAVEPATPSESFATPASTRVLVALLAGLVVLLGLAPSLLLSPIGAALRGAGF